MATNFTTDHRPLTTDLVLSAFWLLPSAVCLPLSASRRLPAVVSASPHLVRHGSLLLSVALSPKSPYYCAVHPNFSQLELSVSPKARVIDTNNLALQKIAPLIHEIRGERVILDSDLAAIYGVPVKALNQAAKRNAERFPEDFVFRLTGVEFSRLRSQIVTSNTRGGRRYFPYAFTEHGAIMAATVLNSKQAVAMSVYVVRAFVKLRDTLATHKELAEKLSELDHKVGTHGRAIVSILATIRQMTEPAGKKARAIGFRVKGKSHDDNPPKQNAQRVRKK